MLNLVGHPANPRIRDELAKRVSDEAQSGWLIVHDQTPAQHAATLRAVFFNDQPRWRSGFAAMLLLSTGVAMLGLNENSAAVILGAMVMAPMGQPIIALGAALAIAWGREAARLLTIILSGAVTVVAAASLLGVLLPEGAVDSELLSRTAPDLRDLGIAVLAGGVGAFAYARDELSGVLPGVAIAVALVPPLAVVGTVLEQGHVPLPIGAMLLFLTNLVGIAVSAAAVMLLTRFAPPPKRRRSPAAVPMLAAAVLAVGAVSVPLVQNYLRQVKAAHQARAAHLSVQRQARATDAQLQSVRISGSQVTIAVAGASEMEQRRLEEDLRSIPGPETTCCTSYRRRQVKRPTTNRCALSSSPAPCDTQLPPSRFSRCPCPLRPATKRTATGIACERGRVLHAHRLLPPAIGHPGAGRCHTYARDQRAEEPELDRLDLPND